MPNWFTSASGLRPCAKRWMRLSRPLSRTSPARSHSLYTKETFLSSAVNLSTRCIAPTCLRSPWATAITRRLQKAGIVSSDELISILQGLDQITEQAAMSPAFLDDDEAEDVHHFVEKQLVVMIGDVGYKLHSGRSRNEQIATDLRLYVRASID